MCGNVVVLTKKHANVLLICNFQGLKKKKRSFKWAYVYFTFTLK